MIQLGKYSKFAVSLGGLFAVLGQMLSDGAISTEEIGQLCSVLAAAILVYVVPNAAKSQ
jgi:hypothetical protein